MTDTTKTRLPARRAATRPDERPESLAALAQRHPGLLLAGGLAAGLLAAALLPRGTGRRLAKGAMAAAAVGSELGLGLAHKARDTAHDAGAYAGEGARRVGQGARRAGTGGLELVRAAMRVISALRR
jgi:hypothetical protein